ncbi:MAG TPA: FmdB family zinc ribbon protein [Rubrobacteraceae bacterium]|nr:FmdB family zinc ribbon protein [Rubrobacteraceae bacterium]
MPIYEYKCENGHVFDVMQKMSEDPLTECVECGAPVKKVLQPVGISFKGSGFYSTDYKNGSSKKAEPAAKTNGDSGSKSGSSETTSTKSESTASGKTSKKD